MLRFVLILALVALASAFVRTPMRAQRIVAPKMLPLEEMPMLIAKASEPRPTLEGNPIIAFLLLSAVIMGSLPGFLSAFEKKYAPKN